MWKNYLNIALRNLVRNKAHTLINLVGLSLGISCTLLIVLYVQDEISYDRHHLRGERIFRISSDMRMGTNEDEFALTSMAVGPRLKEVYPEIDTFVRFRMAPNRISVKYGDKLFNEQFITMVDPQVFSVFTYPLLKGNPETALINPRSLVLTEKLAKKYFGEEEPLGKSVKLNNLDFEVTGVMKDLPANSDLPLNGLTSIADMSEEERNIMMWDWGRMSFYTYLLFKNPEDAIGFENKLEDFAEKNVQPFWKENAVDGEIHYHITALQDLHFRTDLGYDTPKGNRSYLYIFSLVALFILMIACINYINLAIAQSSRRSMEVGIRKAAGASHGQLLRQFLGESLILSLIALGLGIILVEISLPVFNQLAGKSFVFPHLLQPQIIFSGLAIILFTGLVAGSYPAFYLASFHPIEVLKGKIRLSGNSFLRKALVVVQFSISVGLIIATLVVYEQMQFLKNHDLGFEKEQIMVVEVPYDTALYRRLPQVKDELLTHPGINGLATSGRFVPGEGSGTLLFRVEQDNTLKENHFSVVSVDENFREVLKIGLVSGRNFERSRQTDPQQAFIVNEAFVKAMGWEDAIGKRLQWGLMADNQAANDGHIVGVIKDYHFTSLHNKIEPLVWLYNPDTPQRLLISMNGKDMEAAIDFVSARWREIDPNHPLEFFFLDAFFDQLYRREEKMMTIFGYFSLITIIIACMGLFGVSSFITQQRTKEIGIRKILGADTRQLVYLLSRDFGILVLVAIIIASPITWFAMSQWLAGFVFPVVMPSYAFFVAGITSLCIALFTTSYHSLRTAKANPAEALRNE
ncbi:MAG: ABC transporter permease [Bacteroidia bacterium]|nr:ABC transporter permease [Bacteroidia bacterium]